MALMTVGAPEVENEMLNRRLPGRAKEGDLVPMLASPTFSKLKNPIPLPCSYKVMRVPH